MLFDQGILKIAYCFNLERKVKEQKTSNNVPQIKVKSIQCTQEVKNLKQGVTNSFQVSIFQ